MSVLRLLMLSASGLVLGACTTSDTYNVPPMSSAERTWQSQSQGEPPRPPVHATIERYADHLFDGPAAQDFLGALSQGYRELARERDSASDFADAAKFLQRAGAAARGERVWPEEILARTLPRYALQDVIYARTRLMRAFDQGANQRHPRIAARAQVAFDCWMESQEENRYPEYVHRCRAAFEQAMSQLEAREPLPTTAAPAAAARREDMAACAAFSECAPLRLYFPFDRAELTAEEVANLEAFVAAAKERSGPVVLAAHTDRAGSDAYNDQLAQRRLEHVLGLLQARGIERSRIVQARAYGERQVPVPTADGVKEGRNRVVEAWLLTR